MEDFEILKMVAKRDLEDSELLFNKKRYANAVFLLEQADEKAGKAVLLHMGMVLTTNQINKAIQFLGSHPTQYTNLLIQMMTSLQTLAKGNEWQILKKQYGHDWLRSYLRALEKIAEPVDNMASKTGMFQTFRKGFDQNNPAVKNMVWQNGNWKERVMKLQETFKDPKKFLNPTAKYMEGEIAFCKLTFDSFNPEAVNSEELKKQYIEIAGPELAERSFSSNTVDVFVDPIKLFVLGALGLYLTPHYTLSRYLDEKVDFEYNSEFAIVKKNKDIIRLIARCL